MSACNLPNCINEITTHSSNVHNDMKLRGQAFYLMENRFGSFPLAEGGEKNQFELIKNKKQSVSRVLF